MEESQKPKKEFDARSRESAKKKVLMQEKNGKEQRARHNFKFDPTKRRLTKKEHKEKHLNKYGVINFLLPNCIDTKSTNSRQEAKLKMGESTLQAIYEEILNNLSPKSIHFLKQLIKLTPISSLEDLAYKLGVININVLSKSIKSVNKEFGEILKDNKIKIDPYLKSDMLFVEMDSGNGNTLFYLEPYLQKGIDKFLKSTQ